MRPRNFPLPLCGLMVSLFTWSHPCENHTLQIIFGELVSSFSFTNESWKAEFKKTVFLKALSHLQKKNGLVNVPSVFNYVQSQWLTPFVGVSSPARNCGFCVLFNLWNGLKAGSSQWPSLAKRVEHGLLDGRRAQRSFRKRSLPTQSDEPSIFRL